MRTGGDWIGQGEGGGNWRGLDRTRGGNLRERGLAGTREGRGSEGDWIGPGECKRVKGTGGGSGR